MTIEQKTFAAYSILTADDVNNYLMNQVVVQVTTTAELSSVPTTVKAAWTADTGSLYARDASGTWQMMATQAWVNGRKKTGSKSGSTNSSGDITVTHGLGTTPSVVFIQSTTAGAVSAGEYAVTGVNATTFTVHCYYNGSVNASAAVSFYWRAEI